MFINKYFWLFCFFLFVNFSFGFDDNKNLDKDSLWSIWIDASLSDTARINALNEFTWAIYLYDSPDSALILAEKQYDFAVKKELDAWKPSALLIMGRVLDRKGIYTKAIQKYQEAVGYYKESNQISNLGSFYNDMAIIHISMEQYEEAQSYFNKIIKIANQEGDTNELDVYYNNLAILFKMQQDYYSALEYYDKSLKMKIARNDKLGMALVYNNLGSVYLDLEEYSLAYENFMKSYNIRILIKDKNRIITSLNNLCEYFVKINDFNQALVYGQKAVNMSNEMNLKEEMKVAYKQIYLTYKNLNKHDKALEMYEKYNLLNDSIRLEEYSNSLLKLKIKEEYQLRYANDSLKKNFEMKIEQSNLDHVNDISNLKYIILLLSITSLILFGLLLKKQKRAN